MHKTNIGWTDYSWNPVRGTKGTWHCSHVSPGCENCYAEQLNKRFGGGLSFGRGLDTLRVDEKALGAPLRVKKPGRVFVCSMTDLFHESLTFEQIDAVFSIMISSIGGRHTYQVLTKRSERMQDFMVWWLTKTRIDPPPNIWLGVSVEDQRRTSRVIDLLQTPASIRWISAEPLLESVDLTRVACSLPTLPKDHFLLNIAHELDALRGSYYDDNTGLEFDGIPHLDWVVVGGESGPHARTFKPDWARKLLESCKRYSIPFFMKQIGGRTPHSTPIPDDLHVREFPRGRRAPAT